MGDYFIFALGAICSTVLIFGIQHISEEDEKALNQETVYTIDQSINFYKNRDYTAKEARARLGVDEKLESLEMNTRLITTLYQNNGEMKQVVAIYRDEITSLDQNQVDSVMRSHINQVNEKVYKLKWLDKMIKAQSTATLGEPEKQENTK